MLRRRHKSRPLVRFTLPLGSPPAPDDHPGVIKLRAQEAEKDAAATKRQFRETRLAILYGRQIDLGMPPGEWTMLDPDLGGRGAPGWRRGRVGILPTRQNLLNPRWLKIKVADDIADALIERDSKE